MSNAITRRLLFARGATGLGAVALSHLMADGAMADGEMADGDGPRPPSASSTCSRVVGRRSSIYLTTSRYSIRRTVKNCPHPFAMANV